MALAGCAAMAPGDAQLTRQLIGKWSDVRTLECCTRVEQTIELQKNGTFQAHGVRRNREGSAQYSFAGKWKVEDGHLWYKVTSAEPRELHPVGEEHRNRIVSVGESEWVMVEQDTGHESRAWRYPK